MSGSEYIQKNYLFFRKNTSNLKDLCAFFVENGILNLNEIDIIQNPFVNPSRDDKNENLYQILIIKGVSIELLNQAFKTSGNYQFLEKTASPLQNASAGPSRELMEKLTLANPSPYYEYSDHNEIINEIGDQNSNSISVPFNSGISKYEQNLTKESRKSIPLQNLYEIEIVKTKYTLDEKNVETILNSAKENNTVKELICVDIPTELIPQILKKFQSIESLLYYHDKSQNLEYCRYFESRSNKKVEEICLFKIENLNGYSNLKKLALSSISVSFPQILPNLPGLKKLFLFDCDIFGDFIIMICQSTLEVLGLYGNTPSLTKEDVEKLLRIKSMKAIALGKHYKEIFTSSFAPIGPDGNTMNEITPNVEIYFTKESCDMPWEQTVKFHEITDTAFNLTAENILILKSPNSNSTVNWLTCSNISTKRVPDILKKFTNISELEFSHNMNEDGKCTRLVKKSFSSYMRWKQNSCFLKMDELRGFENLNTLCLEGIEVEFPKRFSLSEYLPELRFLEILFCSINGNFINDLVCSPTLKHLKLSGISPSLSKKDVESLLKSQSLILIKFEKFNNRDIFKSSFTPIGSDGKPMDKINLNSEIWFSRESFGIPWIQKSYPIDLDELKLHHRNIESILNSTKENTSVTHLNCNNISTRKVPDILNKFKSIQKFQFHHQINECKKCQYLESYFNKESDDVCLLKMEDLNVCINLKVLRLANLKVSFPQSFPNLPVLKKLELLHCDISGDFINMICQSNLEVLGLMGNSPSLTKENVENILRVKSLKNILLMKYTCEL